MNKKIIVYLCFILVLLLFVGCTKTGSANLETEDESISPVAIKIESEDYVPIQAKATKSAVILEENVINKDITSPETIKVAEKTAEIKPTKSFDASDAIELQKKVDDNVLNSWNLILVNPDNKLPDDFSVSLATVSGNYQLDKRIANIAKVMVVAAKADGVSLQICSAFRSIEKQTTLYNKKVSKYQNQGMSISEAKVKAATIVAVPGTSEHNSGLAIDIITPSYQVLDEGFAETKAFRWLDANASKFGFILRFPKDKQDITKIIYEPWHYRYVGIETAPIIKASGLCLEEFLETMAE